MNESKIDFLTLEVSRLRSEVFELKQMMKLLLESYNDSKNSNVGVSVKSVDMKHDLSNMSNISANLNPSYFAVKKRKSDFRIYWLPAVRSLARYIISNRSCGIRTTYQMMADFLNSQGFRTVRGGDIIVSNIVRLQPLINEVLSETELSDRNKNLL